MPIKYPNFRLLIFFVRHTFFNKFKYVVGVIQHTKPAIGTPAIGTPVIGMGDWLPSEETRLDARLETHARGG